jgi:thiosulfate dehydrogenase (quinone) large subunit
MRIMNWVTGRRSRTTGGGLGAGQGPHSESAQTHLGEPPVARWLFSSVYAAPIWLVVRLYFGYKWLNAGWDKLKDPAWRSSGTALKGFAAGAIKNAQGSHPTVAYGWWVSFLNWIRDASYPWMAKVITAGELTIGLALIIGVFTGIAAFGAMTLNASFGLSGVAGVNPVFVIADVFLMLAWRNAGYLGVDRYVLPALGTPWEKGELWEHPRRRHRGVRPAA